MQVNTTVIFHISEVETKSDDELQNLINKFNSIYHSSHLIAIADANPISLSAKFDEILTIISAKNATFPEQWNSALSKVHTETVLYIDNRHAPVIPADSVLNIFHLAKERNDNAGMIYGDYSINTDDEEQEIHLLPHHPGRLRDNQDYGKMFYFDTAAVKKIGGMDIDLAYNHLYDLRLKLAEQTELIRVANKYSGSLYTVYSGKDKANVFDYLLAGKEQQLEAENTLTNHLERIGAKLYPNQGFKTAPKGDFSLTASVIIPVNNRPEFIGTAIESVQNQSISEIEVLVVVNGGKDDPTIPAVKEYLSGGNKYDSNKPEVRLLITDINNIGFCLNYGATNANGKYYVQLDSDDRLKANAVESIVKVFDSDPTVGMVIGSYDVWEKKGSGELVRMDEIPVVTHDEWTDDNGRNNLLRINGAGAPRSIPIALIKSIGWFGINDDPYALNYGEDYDMVLRISEQYKIGRIYSPIYEVIRHSGGTDHAINQAVVDRNDEAKDWMRLEALQRRQNA
ncbi:MAG: glycosyltransferase family 2 protein [Candidatus Marinimicrobia bacterium]|nr:glycosyltransferase family 2 protein [Candidatus Neomarinimicrobiota bacterium]